MLKASFILLTILLAVLLIAGAKEIAKKAFTDAYTRRQFKIKTILWLTAWLAYISLLSLRGVFTDSSLPPRIPLLLILPTFLFIIYFFTNRRFKTIIDATPPAWPVYFQSFRVIVELLILGLFLNGMLPKAATFEGYNFDIIIGITAPAVAYFIAAKSKALTLLWNFAGILTLLAVVTILLSHAYFYKLDNESESILNKGLGIFPFTFLAGFFMPLAFFMHIFSIIKTRKELQNKIALRS